MQLLPNSPEPIYLQISNAIASQSLQGDQKAGMTIASSRQLAASLGVGRGKVPRAYEELRHKQLIQITQGGKPIVTFEEPTPSLKHFIKTSYEHGLSAFGKRLQSEGISLQISEALERNAGALPEEMLPQKAWRALIAKHASSPIEAERAVDCFGLPELRLALQQYLSRSRGVICSPEQICVLPDAQLGIDLICKLMVDQDDYVLMEEPSSRTIQQIFKSHGAAIVSVPIDSNGIQMNGLEKLEVYPKLAYVTPAHHNPTGYVMSQSTREALLHWANLRRTLVIEDDHDGEFRYTNNRARALQGMDPESVVYVSSFSKILHPLTSLSFIVFPPGLVDLARRAKQLVQRNQAILEQQVLADFINSGILERYIGRTRITFASRRQMLIMSLAREFATLCRPAKETGATHQLVHFDLPNSDNQVYEASMRTALPFINTTPWYSNDSRRAAGEFLIPFASLSEAEIEHAVAQIAKELRAEAIDFCYSA